MSVFLSPVGGAGAQFFDNNGNPLTGGKLYTYAAGTTTPLTAYTTSAGNVAHTNPIVLDAAGRVPAGGEIWISENTLYKFVLETSTGVLIATWNDIDGINDPPDAFGIAYLPPFTGAVATTVGDELAQMVRLSDFGADETGVADSSTAISNALAYLGGIGGGTLELSNGAEYLVSSLVTMSQSNIVINGNGAKLKAVGSQGILDVSGTRNTVQNVVFDHQNTAAMIASLRITGSLNKVIGNTFNDVCEYSLEVSTGSTDTSVIGNTFDKTDPTSFNVVVNGVRTLVDGNMILNGDAGVVVVGASVSDVIIVNNFIKDSLEVGIDLLGSGGIAENIIIANNKIYNTNASGIRVGTVSAGGLYAKKVLVANNLVVDCGAGPQNAAGIAATGDGSATDFDISIIGNTVIGKTGVSAGIAIANGFGFTVQNNRVTKCPTGIGIYAGAKNSIVSGNVAHDNTEYGIYVEYATLDNVGKLILSNNVVRSNGTVGVSGVGIYILQGVGTQILDNIICEDQVPAKQLIGLDLQQNAGGSQIDGNKIYGHSTDVTFTAPSTAASFTWGDNFDANGTNKTRYVSTVGFPGTATVTFNPNLWFAPRFVGGTADLNEFVWSSSVAANSVTLSRVAAVGTLIFRTEVRV